MENKQMAMTFIDSKELSIRPFLNKRAEEIYKNRPIWYRGSKFRKLNKRKQKKILKRCFKGVLLTIDESTLVNSELSKPMVLHAEIGPQEIKLVTKLNISENY